MGVCGSLSSNGSRPPCRKKISKAERRLDVTRVAPHKEGCFRRCWLTSICTGLIESSTAGRTGPTGQGDVDPVCGRLRDYGAVHEPADSELHRAEIGGMAGAKTQPRQDPDSQSTPEPSALRVPRLSNRFGPCEGGPTPPLLAHGAEPQGDEARSGQNLGNDGAQIRMETAARTHRRAQSAPQGLGELLPAWPTTDSLSTDQSLRTATALSAPAPQ